MVTKPTSGSGGWSLLDHSRYHYPTNEPRSWKFPIEKASQNLSELTPDWYKSPYKYSVEQPSLSGYSTIYSILWWTSVALGSAVVLGACYMGYKFISDPLFIENINIFKSKNDIDVPTEGPVTNVIEATPSTSSSGSNSTKSLVSLISKIGSTTSITLKKLNPLSWYPSSSEIEMHRRLFDLNQADQLHSKNNFYPFKEIHPYDSWFKRLRIHYLGETLYERKIRHLEEKRIWAIWFPSDIELNPKSGILSPAISSPNVGQIGLSPSASTSQIAWMMNETTSTVLNKLQSLPTSPSGPLSPLPESSL